MFSLIFLLSCNSTIVKIPEKQVEMNLFINALSDSSYFTDIRSIYYCNSEYFLSEYNRDNILVLNDSLNLINIIGSKGKGPGELLGASHLFLKDSDSIFILNDAKKTIELFSSEMHLSTFDIANEINFSGDMRFCVRNDTVFLSNSSKKSSISSFSFKTRCFDTFGDVIHYSTPKEMQVKNRRHLHSYKDNIIAIPDCHPLIELYSLIDEKSNVIRLDNISPINKVVKYIKGEVTKSNSYLQFFPDSYIYKNNLFVLFISIMGDGKKECNKILQLEINDMQIFPIQILDLGSGWYGPICVNEYGILAFDQNSKTLKRFSYE
jgi:hypothetical protein